MFKNDDTETSLCLKNDDNESLLRLKTAKLNFSLVKYRSKMMMMIPTTKSLELSSLSARKNGDTDNSLSIETNNHSTRVCHCALVRYARSLVRSFLSQFPRYFSFSGLRRPKCLYTISRLKFDI